MCSCSVVLVLKKLCSLLLKGYTWKISIPGKSNSSPLRQYTMDRTCLCACLPTGFGKNLCYQAISFVMDFKLGRARTSKTSAILVVSPLVSPMVDQAEDLRRRKVKTSIITSNSGSDLAKPLLAGETSLFTDSLLFCAPEALALLSIRPVCKDFKHVG